MKKVLRQKCYMLHAIARGLSGCLMKKVLRLIPDASWVTRAVFEWLPYEEGIKTTLQG